MLHFGASCGLPAGRTCSEEQRAGSSDSSNLPLKITVVSSLLVRQRLTPDLAATRREFSILPAERGAGDEKGHGKQSCAGGSWPFVFPENMAQCVCAYVYTHTQTHICMCVYAYAYMHTRLSHIHKHISFA